MAVSDTVLSACRAQVAASPELAAFRAALAALDAAARADRARLWRAAYGDNQAGLSPAYRLRKAVRDAVAAACGESTPWADREAAYRTLAAEFAPDSPAPASAADEQAELEQLLLEDRLS